MSLTLLRRILATGAACAAMTVGVSSVGFAQPSYGDKDYAADQAPAVGEITVRPTFRNERTYNGAEIVMARASRVVDVSDLDLSTAWGQHMLYRRVTNAAADACDDLDNDWVMGLYPTADDNDADCVHRAVDRAMRAASIPY
jgi:UrcA family protein